MPALRISVGLVVKPLIWGFAYIFNDAVEIGAVGEDLYSQLIDRGHAGVSCEI